jgi:hypothetical protein
LRAHAEDPRLPELAHCSRLDAVAYSRDLWGSLAYTTLSTVWTPQLFRLFFLPRRNYQDLESGRGMPGERSPLPRQNRAVGGKRSASAPDRAVALPTLARSPALVFPPPLRDRTLLLVLRANPHAERQGGKAGEAVGSAITPLLVEGLTKLRFAAVAVEGSYSADDFTDSLHLSESGGRKLAAEVAPAVRGLARRLGYTPAAPSR